jgi:thiol-disulfide isomerase/thioredoxin
MSTAGDNIEGAGSAHRRPRLVFLVIGLVIAAALAGVLYVIGSHAEAGGGGTARPAAGTVAPHFTLPALGGARGTVGVPADGGGEGRPAILLFFASWCTQCHREIPVIAATYRNQQLQHSRLTNVALIGVDGNDPTSDALAFVRSSGVTFPVGADVDFTVTQTLFDFNYLPESVFVEANGTIAGIHLGPLSKRAFVSWEHQLLAGA